MFSSWPYIQTHGIWTKWSVDRLHCLCVCFCSTLFFFNLYIFSYFLSAVFTLWIIANKVFGRARVTLIEIFVRSGANGKYGLFGLDTDRQLALWRVAKRYDVQFVHMYVCMYVWGGGACTQRRMKNECDV